MKVRRPVAVVSAGSSTSPRSARRTTEEFAAAICSTRPLWTSPVVESQESLPAHGGPGAVACHAAALRSEQTELLLVRHRRPHHVDIEVVAIGDLSDRLAGVVACRRGADPAERTQAPCLSSASVASAWPG
jgi:hypothetical protein